jgi:membrane-associated phospholipid phosphatase
MNWASLLEKDGRWSARLRLPDAKSPLRLLAVFFAHSGDSWFWLVGLVLVWLLSKGEWHDKAAMLVVAIALLAGVVMAVKFTVRRQRPKGEWGAIYRSIDPHSFPSGHAARAAMLAVLACGLGPTWFALVMVVWAPLVSLARVLMGVHYLSDILAGVLVGLLAGWLVLALQPLLISLLPFLF